MSTEVATTPLEKAEAVRDWISDGIAKSLDWDPSGFALGIEASSAQSAMDDVIAELRRV